MKKLITLVCAVFCSNAVYAFETYRCEGEIGYLAENAVVKYGLNQFSQKEIVVALGIFEDWALVSAQRYVDGKRQYKYPRANSVARSIDETGEMHSFYSFDAEKQIGHIFNITYRTDGMFGLKPKEQLGLKTITYDQATTTETWYSCKPL